MTSPDSATLRAVAARVYEVAVRTPLELAPTLSVRTGNRVWLKREDQQPVHSFKLRGAYAMMASLTPEELARGVVAASAGNHAQGVALAARRLGTSAIIVVPNTAPPIKIAAIRALGGEVVVAGDTYDDAGARAREIERAEGRVFVPPFDHPLVIAGQGTIGTELAEEAKGLDAVFVAIGGGGLVAGVGQELRRLRPGVRIIGVEPETSDAMTRSLAAGERVTLPKVGTFADGVAVRTVGEHNFRIAQEVIDETILVSDDEICGAIKEIFEDRRAILEPAGALAYAGLKKWAEREGARDLDLVAIACGANLNFDRLGTIAARAVLGVGHAALLAVRIPERPGAFRSLCRALGDRPVTEFNYRMSDRDRAIVFVGVRVENRAERETMLAALEGDGYATLDLTGDETAKVHLRHMVGGRSDLPEHERTFAFDFPERPGALAQFLDRLASRWNISLFHYRNHGAETGRVLVGFEVPPVTDEEFARFRLATGYDSIERTEHPAMALFLGSPNGSPGGSPRRAVSGEA